MVAEICVKMFFYNLLFANKSEKKIELRKIMN